MLNVFYSKVQPVIAALPPVSSNGNDLHLLLPYDVEERLSDVLNINGIFLAIGDKDFSFGSVKVHTQEELWREYFHRFTRDAILIFICPGDSDGVLWELGQILSSPDLLTKTILVMPPAAPRIVDLFTRRGSMERRAWKNAKRAIGEVFHVRLPLYSRYGCYFRLQQNKCTFEIADLHSMNDAIRKALVRHRSGSGTLDVNSLWKEAVGIAHSGHGTIHDSRSTIVNAVDVAERQGWATVLADCSPHILNL